MSKDQWTDLENLAKAATPGPWECIRGNIVRVCQVGDADEFQREICVHYVNPDGGRNPEFMAAAHPETIITLIALARSEAVLREALLKAQWLGGRDEEDPSCPYCAYFKRNGIHQEACIFQALAESDRLRGGGG